jgi:hypothetical protein
VNQQVNPSNTSNSSAGTAAQTVNKQNSGYLPLPLNPVAAAAYEKASKTTQSTDSLGKRGCTSNGTSVCPAHY